MILSAPLFRALVIASIAVSVFSSPLQIALAENTCNVKSDPNGGDDSPAIKSAFQQCGQGGRIVFGDKKYHVNKVMNTTGLRNVRIELRGQLLVSLSPRQWLNS